MWGSRDKTQREQELERELDDLRYEQSRERERVSREREEERKSRMESYRQQQSEYERSANSWREALSKQSSLCWREANRFPNLDNPNEEDYFEASAIACDFGLQVWDAVEDKYADALAKAREQLELIRVSIQKDVADLILQEYPNSNAARNVAQVLTDDDDPSAWLDW